MKTVVLVFILCIPQSDFLVEVIWCGCRVVMDDT